MLIIVTGGAASGKSAYAESIIARSGIYPREYVACMEVRDAEDMLRVERHRKLRESKGFDTLEAPHGLERLRVKKDSAVLIEDIANLAANECFSTEEGFDGAYERIMRGVGTVVRDASLTVVVTCETGADGAHYDECTAAYIALLARLNAGIADIADEAYEVVCGIPLCIKGNDNGGKRH